MMLALIDCSSMAFADYRWTFGRLVSQGTCAPVLGRLVPSPPCVSLHGPRLFSYRGVQQYGTDTSRGRRFGVPGAVTST